MSARIKKISDFCFSRFRYLRLIVRELKQQRQRRKTIGSFYYNCIVCSDNIYYIINSYRYVSIVNCIVTEKPHQGSVNKVLYCLTSKTT